MLTINKDEPFYLAQKIMDVMEDNHAGEEQEQELANELKNHFIYNPESMTNIAMCLLSMFGEHLDQLCKQHEIPC